MKGSVIRVIIFMIAIGSFHFAIGQLYKPNDKAKEKLAALQMEYRYQLFTDFSLLSKKEIGKLSKSIEKCIELDTNYADPYAIMGAIKMTAVELLAGRGAYYYFSKYEEKMNKFKIASQAANIKLQRIRCLIAAFSVNPDYFDANKSALSGVSPSLIGLYLDQCITDLEMAKATHRDYYDLFSLKSDYLISKLDFEGAEKTLNSLNSFLNSGLDYSNGRYADALQRELCPLVKERLVKLFLLKNDNKSAIDVLISYLAFSPVSESTWEDNFNSLNQQEKRNALIQLVNVENHFEEGSYETVIIDGVEVFSDNNNMRVDNYASAVAFLQAYNKGDMLSKVFGKQWSSKLNHTRSGLPTSKDVYQFYLTSGKAAGMIWPKYGEVKFQREMLESDWEHLVENLYTCGCINEKILDVEVIYPDVIKVFVQSSRDSSLTALSLIPMKTNQDYNLLLKIPLEYYDKKHQRVYQTFDVKVLPTIKSCEKLFELAKREEENRIALERAQQLRQEQEIRRLEQEQNYKQTQLRILEEENRKKQNEIELYNTRNRQLEQQKSIEAAKVESARLEREAKNVPDNQSVAPLTSSNSPKGHHCEWCNKRFSGDGFDYDRNSNDCRIREQVAVPLFGLTIPAKYCSTTCAYKACQADH